MNFNLKKALLTAFISAALITTLTSCNSTPPASDNEAQTGGDQTIQTPSETGKEENKDKTIEGFDPADFKFYKVFEAPEGDYRQIVKDYMIKMSEYKWIAGEDFNITWKKQGDFKVNLEFKKGQTYYGLPYSEARSSLEQFAMFCPDGGTFTHPTYYYEEIVGNHCSSSMGLAYQQLIDFPYSPSLKPIGERIGVTKLIDGLEKPEGDSWISEDVISLNGKEKIFEAYTKMGTGDILGKFIKGTGHTRMVDEVVLKTSVTGKINYANSYVSCIEQTNQFDQSLKDKKTTWWIGHTYTFNELINDNFIPITLEIFHNGEDISDAVIAFDDQNTPESILKTLNGTVSSNFPLAYVRATVENENGEIVGEFYEYKFNKQYKLNLRSRYSQLNIDKLEAGNYTYTLRAGIGRGGCEIESFGFTVN